MRFITTHKVSNFDAVKGSIESGDWFLVSGERKYQWYYRVEKLSAMDKERRIYQLRRQNPTSSTTSFVKELYQFVDDENGLKILAGKDLQEYILLQTKIWVKQLNLAKMTSPSGHRYASFLNAIPTEIFQDNSVYEELFGEKLRKVISEGIGKRIEKERTQKNKKLLVLCNDVSNKIIDDRMSGKYCNVLGSKNAIGEFEKILHSSNGDGK